MRLLKTIALTLAALMIALNVSSCNSVKTQSSKSSENKKADDADIFDFKSYENSDIFEIEKISLNNELSKKCDSYKFTYMSDDNKVKAYVSIPTSAKNSGKPCKCVLFNRGGNSNLGFLEDGTTAILCSVFDRVIIASQYRGANGVEGNDEFGGEDLNDVIRLIDLCQNKFSFVDMDDFCVAGASRGGMMTYMAARRDSRVKKIVAVAAVSDLFRSYEEREDMRDVLKYSIGWTPEENPDEYKKRSAIYWYNEIKVPVLMIHSKMDKQVSFSQAQELYSKLREVTDCTFITHDDDVHGIHKEDYEKIKIWLDSH